MRWLPCLIGKLHGVQNCRRLSILDSKCRFIGVHFLKSLDIEEQSCILFHQKWSTFVVEALALLLKHVETLFPITTKLVRVDLLIQNPCVIRLRQLTRPVLMVRGRTRLKFFIEFVLVLILSTLISRRAAYNPQQGTLRP